MTLSEIANAVAALQGVSVQGLTASHGYRRVRRARDCAMWCSKQLTDASLEEICRHFGRKSHKSVTDACARYEQAYSFVHRVQVLLRVMWWPEAYGLTEKEIQKHLFGKFAVKMRAAE